MFYLRNYFFFFIAFIFGSVANSQTYNFSSYTVEDGLSRSEILSLFQDKKGCIWFGTAGGGVSIFDGKNFKNLSTRTGLINNDINYIFQGSNDDIWIATNEGVSRIRGNSIENIGKGRGLVSNKIVGIVEDKKGNIWFRSMEEGVSKFDIGTSKISSYNKLNGLADNIIYDMLISEKGSIYFASSQGLNVMNNNSGKIERVSLGIPGQAFQISSVIADKEGSIWLGTWGSGLIKYNPATGRSARIAVGSGPLGGDIIITLALGENNEVWIGTLGSGILRYKEGKLKSYGSNQSQSIGFVYKIKIDKNGDAWIITSDESIYRINKEENLFKYHSRNGLTDDKVKIVFEDREGNIWLGTQKGGACKFNGDAFVFLDRKDGLDNSFVQSIAHSNTETYISTGTRGIFSFKTTGAFELIKKLEEQNGLYSNYISSIYHDKKTNRWWIGSIGSGLLIKNPDQIFNKRNGLSGNRVSYISGTGSKVLICTDEGLDLFKVNGTKIKSVSLGQMKIKGIQSCIEDASGNLWITSMDSILVKYDGNKFFSYNTQSRLSGAILFDADGNLILGTEENGLLKANVKSETFSFSHLIMPEEINYAGVSSLIEDDKKKLWIGTTNGIYLYQSLNGTSSLQSYRKEDGMISVVCNKNSISIDGRNCIWVGTENGAIRIDPEKIKMNSDTPITRITGLKLFYKNEGLEEYADSIDKTTSLPIGLDLPYDNNQLTFQFVGTSLTVPEKVKYRYMLSPLDKTWSEPVNEDYTTYSFLPPGNYEFRVIACNSDGVWNKVPAIVSFRITPPFWKTWWFISLSILLVAGIILLIYFNRITQIKRTAGLQQKVVETEQMALRAQMNPHFIFNSLNSIQHFITDKDVKSANRYLSKFSKLMRMILDNSKKPTVNLAEELESLKLYLELESLRFENKFDYHIEIADNIDPYGVEIPAMLLQPYLENAIWHGLTHKKVKGEIWVRFELEKDFLICEMEDNGIGRKKAQELKIEHPAQHTSSGMRITSERLQSIGALKNTKAEMKIIDLLDEAGEGRGTLVRLIIPID